jgi:hypothetical protein
MDTMWIALGIGLLIGVVISIIFGIYSRAGAEPYIRMFFGISSYDLIFDGMIFMLSAGAFFLVVLSCLIRDSSYPMNTSINFILETFLMAVLPAVGFLAMAGLRGYHLDSEVAMEFSVLVLKFGVLHVLLQFSGFYSNVFPPLKK